MQSGGGGRGGHNWQCQDLLPAQRLLLMVSGLSCVVLGIEQGLATYKVNTLTSIPGLSLGPT